MTRTERSALRVETSATTLYLDFDKAIKVTGYLGKQYEMPYVCTLIFLSEPYDYLGRSPVVLASGQGYGRTEQDAYDAASYQMGRNYDELERKRKTREAVQRSW